MSTRKKISFSKEYLHEIAINKLREIHNIPINYSTVIREYGSDDYLSFVEVTEESQDQNPEEG